MKILFFGDIVGRIGREAVKRVLPELRDELSPDLVIGNAENLSHGKGVTIKAFQEMLDMGFDLMTSGNHIFRQQEVHKIFTDRRLKDKLMRPANYPPAAPGEGAKFLTVGAKNVLVLNFLGRVNGPVLVDDPFRALDDALAAHAHRKPSVILVDFHAETTSEKAAFGWYADGRVSAVWGTHTHVPTADARVLPGGTAFITDVGMCGFRDGVIGVTKGPILTHFTTQLPVRHEVPNEGEAVVNAILITVGSDGKAEAIDHVQRTLLIP